MAQQNFNKIEFREYKDEDYFEVAIILNQLSTVETRTDKQILKTHQRLKKYGPDARIVGQFDGKIVCYGTGVLDLKVRGGLCMHIEDIAVAKDMHRTGIGKSLILYLMGVAKKLGCYKVQLSTTPNNINFYKNCGLCQDGSVQFTKLILE